MYWCTADIGWVTGHTYIMYGPLSNGATQVVYEGTPNSPNEHRHFEVIEKYGVTIYYTAPTLIRMFMKWGRQIPDAHDLSSLRLLGSVGEPINPEAWRWYRDAFGGNRTPVVDTWWQTETGAIMISPLPGVTEAKPGSAMTPLPGISAKIVDEEGNELVPGADEGEHVTGYLVLDAAVAVDAARHLGRPRAVQGDVLVALRGARAGISQATERASTPTDRSGCLAASTT